jgi:hypothetical protein
MALLTVLAFLGLIIVVIVKLVHPRRPQEAKDFQPDNVLGGARTAENEDLRKGGDPLPYSVRGHLLTVSATRVGKDKTLIFKALLEAYEMDRDRRH